MAHRRTSHICTNATANIAQRRSDAQWDTAATNVNQLNANIEARCAAPEATAHCSCGRTGTVIRAEAPAVQVSVAARPCLRLADVPCSRCVKPSVPSRRSLRAAWPPSRPCASGPVAFCAEPALPKTVWYHDLENQALDSALDGARNSRGLKHGTLVQRRCANPRIERGAHQHISRKHSGLTYRGSGRCLRVDPRSCRSCRDTAPPMSSRSAVDRCAASRRCW